MINFSSYWFWKFLDGNSIKEIVFEMLIKSENIGLASEVCLGALIIIDSRFSPAAGWGLVEIVWIVHKFGL